MTQRQIKVLIVNDQEDVCLLWDRFLNTTPDMMSVGYALSGQVAIELVAQTMPDVIMMDVMMPAMDGYETTRHIKNIHPHIRIIIYSAYTGKSQEAYRAGAHHFLLMPITPEKLTDVIRQVMSEEV